MDQQPYVFISYAHADSSKVLPCINAMRQHDISIWYDEGIEAGSEWPEFIAQKVISCTKFLLFVSNAYLSSQNCKRELNFAISRKKDILTIYLEEVELSPGMEMQLGTYQAIYLNRFAHMQDFHNSLCQEHYFDPCRAGQSVPVQAPAQPQPAPAKPALPVYQPPVQGYAPVNQPVQPYAPVQTYVPVQPFVPAKPLPVKSRIRAAIFAMTLGWLGVHKFYLRRPVWGILYAVFCWTYIPFFLGILDGIILFCTSNARFEKKYKCKID